MVTAKIGREIVGPDRKKYVISDFLGHGAFGEVYRAVSKTTGAVIAIKVLRLGELADESSRNALINEMKAAQEVQHPNVVRVLHVDNGTVPDIGPYVCLEYISGGTLGNMLRAQAQARVQVPLSRALEMMIDIAQGARAINEKLIHRDIKPDNVLIEDKTLKIGDFGISKFIDESTRLHTFKGGQHVAYMAPEGWVNERNTYKLDVYAVGLLFYEILALSHPLRAKLKDATNILEWENVHLYEACPDIRAVRKEVPISLAQLISRMVSKRPQDRPTWDEILKVLTEPSIDPQTSRSKTISTAVEAAVEKQRAQEASELKSAQQSREVDRQHRLYSLSCDDLLARFQVAVEQFNSEFQYGSIKSAREWSCSRYQLPTGSQVEVTFFQPLATRIRLRGGQVIGGGWIGISGGRSENLVLLKFGSDDLYGIWKVCEIGIMALVDPYKLLGRFGINEKTVIPFGFKDSYFYEQIAYAQGGMHAFTYTFIDDVEDYFAALIHEACKS